MGASIRVVANRTGIGAHTLRVWERRYGFPQPERRPGGTREYTEADVARLTLVARALAAGFRAGEVVPLPAADVARLLEAAPVASGEAKESAQREALPPDIVARIIEDLLADDIEGVQAKLRSAARVLGPKELVTVVAHPLALQIGDLWQQKKLEVRHEHLASACLTRELHALLGDDTGEGRSPLVVLATLPGEHHVLPLDMVAVYLSASGAAPRMLGANTPPADIAAAARAMRADAVGLSISAVAARVEAEAHVRELLDELPRRTELWLGGAGARAVVVAVEQPGVRYVGTWPALDIALRASRAA